MNREQIMEWIELELSSGGNAEKTAWGMIALDVDTFGFESWLMLNHEAVVDSFREATYETSKSLCEDFEAALQQERMLDNLSIEQSYRLNPSESIKAYTNGVNDIFLALSRYLEFQSTAQALYEPTE